MSQSEHTTFTLDDILDQIGDLADQASGIDPDAVATTIQALVAIQDSGELPEGATAEDLVMLVRLATATQVYVEAIRQMNAEIAKQMAEKADQEVQP